MSSYLFRQFKYIIFQVFTCSSFSFINSQWVEQWHLVKAVSRFWTGNLWRVDLAVLQADDNLVSIATRPSQSHIAFLETVRSAVTQSRQSHDPLYWNRICTNREIPEWLKENTAINKQSYSLKGRSPLLPHWEWYWSMQPWFHTLLPPLTSIWESPRAKENWPHWGQIFFGPWGLPNFI